MRPSICFMPNDSGFNSYSKIMIDILNSIGDVDTNITYKAILKEILAFNLKKRDLIFINWLESKLVTRKGRINPLGIVSFFLIILACKIKFRKVIYTKHNFYPHNTNKPLVPFLIFIIEKMSSLCDTVIVHSPTAVKKKEIYIPHPLYRFNEEKIECDYNKQKTVHGSEYSYVVFGSISAYKKIDYLIKAFPSAKRLLILGWSDNQDYLSELSRLADNYPNVNIKTGKFSDEEIKKIIANGYIMILNHHSADMIVSGSFFFGLSIGIPMISFRTPYTEWANDTFGDNLIRLIDNYEQLREMINDVPIIPNELFIKAVKEKFSDKVIVQNLMKIIY